MSTPPDISLVDPLQIDTAAWNALLATQAQPTPFMRLEYLQALQRSRSAVPATGWTPRFLICERAGELIGAVPAYLKTHSYGEYVFDWAWAEAYERHGLAYYPKLLVAVPFTPVPGSRLLATDDETRIWLLKALLSVARQEQASSLHVLFPHAADVGATVELGLSQRRGVQFHWQRDAALAEPSFSAFLATLQRDKRKKIQQERRRVLEAGVHFTVHEGAAITDALWDFFYACYRNTYAEHHSTPYLTRAFFGEMAAHMAEHWVMFVARRGAVDAHSDEAPPIAVSLVAMDRATGVAWGRYWGCSEHIPCLHFEACYYQPLQWCIEQGFVRFEGGAQGEHKMARGLLPVATSSAHWLAHPQFAQAVNDFVQREGQANAGYIDELSERSPFK